MRSWSLRWKLTVLMIGLVTTSILAASAIHGWFALRALKEDVRVRAAGIASEIAFGISSVRELEDQELLTGQLRNILTARPTLRWLDVYAATPRGISLAASSRSPTPAEPAALARQVLTERRAVTTRGTVGKEEVWLAGAPIFIQGHEVGAVALAMSHEGAESLAVNLRDQLLFALLGAGLTIVAGLALFMEYSVNRPIRSLLKTMAAAEAGDMTALPSFRRCDEMGNLADGLSRMLSRIRESQAENIRLLERTSRFNQELQSRVAEATQELVDRNQALRRASELLFDLQRELNGAQRLATLGQLTARIAHEIGTPLNSVALHLQLLARSPGLSEQDRRRLVTIDGQIQRLVGTVKELLASTRRQSQRIEPTDLNRLVQGVADLVGPVLAAKRIAYTADPDATLPLVLADATQIQQVLLNLLTNAVDAMPDGGALRVTTRRQDGEAVLSVADTGSGVQSELRARIFEPFFTTKENQGGTGLGLAICRQIVRGHGGTIVVTETAGGGATFEVRLPLTSPEGAA